MVHLCSTVTIKIIIILLIQDKYVKCAIKKWIPNINYDNPGHWEKSKLPCPQDTVIFPEKFNAALTLPNSIKIDEIVLPNDGYILMGPNSVISFDKDNLESRCRGHLKEEMKFNEPSVGLWFLSKNWYLTDPHLRGMRDNPAVPQEVNSNIDNIHYNYVLKYYI